MSRRKDNKGRVLRTGESQRKDLIYQYRYTDALGNRKCIYASDLKTLREKEDELQRSLEGGLDYAGGEITVYELLQRYLSLKCGVRYNTKVGYGFVMNIVQKEPFGARKIRDIKVSDAQRWMIKLQKEGKGYSTLTSIRGVVKPAFQMAYNEEVVRRNPFDFKLTDVVVNDSQKRISMTEKQQKVWMNFIREDKSYAKYYDEFVVLLGTGIKDRIIFTGYIDYNDMPSIYQLGNIAVLPSMWEEPAGMTMVEAVVSGLPLITTNSGGIPEYISDDVAVLLDRDENLVDNIRDTIVKIKEHPMEYDYIKKSRDKFMEKYKLDKYYNDFASIIMR